MSLLQFILAPANVPFLAASVVVLILFLIEAVLLLFGGSALDMGDLDGGELDTDVDGAVPALEWLHVGSLPLLLILLLFSLGFAVGGYGAQWVALRAGGALLPPWLAALVALAVAVPTLRLGGTGLLRTLLREDTSAAHSDALLGRTATLVLGDALPGRPSQAKVQDAYGQTHYVLVEPPAGQTLPAASDVILVARTGPLYQAVPNSSAALFALDQNAS